MNYQITPIAYSGISDQDLESFTTKGSKLNVYCDEPEHISTGDSITYTINEFPSQTYDPSPHPYTLVDNNIIYSGTGGLPWAMRTSINDLNSSLTYHHWGVRFEDFLGSWNLINFIVSPQIVTVDDRRFILCIKNNIPVLLSYTGATSLLGSDTKLYYLFDKPVDHIQWIKPPNSEFYKILFVVSSTMYFIDLPTDTRAYTVLSSGIPIKTPKYFLGSVPYQQQYNENMRLRQVQFYYHNSTLCMFLGNRGSTQFLNDTTSFYHWDGTIKDFSLDVTVPLYAPTMYYSQYNKAVNFVTRSYDYLGDYRWYVVTPMSDLYTFFSSLANANLFESDFNNKGSLGGYGLSLATTVELGNYVSHIYQDVRLRSGRDAPWYMRVKVITYAQPKATMGLFNMNTGIPFGAISGDFELYGDLFYSNFSWEIHSEKEFREVEGAVNIDVYDPSIVNFRLTPTVAQSLDSIVYKEKEYRDYEIIFVDERTSTILLYYKDISEFNQVRLSLFSSLFTPYLLLQYGEDRIAHCKYNLGNACQKTRSEFKTALCNESCTSYLKNEIVVPIITGNNISINLVDNRAIVPPHRNIANISVKFEY